MVGTQQIAPLGHRHCFGMQIIQYKTSKVSLQLQAGVLLFCFVFIDDSLSVHKNFSVTVFIIPVLVILLSPVYFLGVLNQ